MRFFIVDRRYGAVKTLEKRKELFAEWQLERQSFEEEGRKSRRDAAMPGLLELLGEAEGQTLLRELLKEREPGGAGSKMRVCISEGREE